MKKQLFVGGFGGSGTRVVQMILKHAGYYVGGDFFLNAAYDAYGLCFVRAFDDYFFRNNLESLKVLFKRDLNGRDSWSIKHGHLMFCIPLLKKWYPDSEFIYVLRNPIDNMLNAFQTHHKYGGLSLDAPIEDKVKYHLEETRATLENTDYVVKLEDLCFNRSKAISGLLDFANVQSYDIEDYINIVRTPSTIGRGKEFYEKFGDLEEFSYIKELGYTLIEEDKELAIS